MVLIFGVILNVGMFVKLEVSVLNVDVDVMN